MLTLFTVPSSTTVLAGVANVSNPFFAEFLPIIYITVGVFAAALLALWLKNVLVGGIGHFFSKKHSTPQAHFDYGADDINNLRATYIYHKTGMWPK